MIWRGRNEPPSEPGSLASGPGADPAPEPGAAEPLPGDSVGGRIETILDAAERAAAGIREDAQEWARRYAEEARRKADEAAASRIQELSGLTDELVRRARSVAQQSDDLLSALDEAGRRVLETARGNEAGPPVPAKPPQTEEERQPAPSAQPTDRWRPAAERPATAAPPSPTPSQAPAPAPPESAPAQEPASKPAPATGNSGHVSEGARLLATQMAVAGSTRDEIAWRLREEFGIQDSSAILDEIGI